MKPLQSKPSVGEAFPHRYGTPCKLNAYCVTLGKGDGATVSDFSGAVEQPAISRNTINSPERIMTMVSNAWFIRCTLSDLTKGETLKVRDNLGVNPFKHIILTNLILLNLILSSKGFD